MGGRFPLIVCGRANVVEYTDAGREPSYSEKDSRRGMVPFRAALTVLREAEGQIRGDLVEGRGAQG